MTYPLKSGPAIINRSRERILRRKSIIDIENKRARLYAHPSTKRIVGFMAAKHPSSTMVINVRWSLHRLIDFCGFENADCDFAILDGALLVCYAKDGGTGVAAVGGYVSAWGGAEGGNGDLMGV